jgi:hypothetical protein
MYALVYDRVAGIKMLPPLKMLASIIKKMDRPH